MKPRSRSSIAAFGVIEVVAIVAVVGWLGPKVLPSAFDKRTKQAEQSADASAQVEQAVAKERDANTRQNAVVAASVVKIGEAASDAPASPWATFVQREATHVLPLLPAPDYKALYAAEARKRAVLEGKLELADKLYAADAKDKQRVLDENAKLRAKIAVAFAERREVDTELAESAAYARGKDAVIGVLFALAALCGVGWFIARKTSLPKLALAHMANRARDGQTAMDVIDGVVPDTWHDEIEKLAAALRAKEAAKLAARQAAAA